MNNKYDFYIDESCHLEHDNIPVMCIGYIKVPMNEYAELQKEFNQKRKLCSEILEKLLLISSFL